MTKKLNSRMVQILRYLYWVKGIDTRCLYRMYEPRLKIKYTTLWDVINYNTWVYIPNIFTDNDIHPIRRLK